MKIKLKQCIIHKVLERKFGKIGDTYALQVVNQILPSGHHMLKCSFFLTTQITEDTNDYNHSSSRPHTLSTNTLQFNRKTLDRFQLAGFLKYLMRWYLQILLTHTRNYK